MAIRNENGKMYHIGLREGDVGRYVLLPGDPGRVPLIAAYLNEAHQVGSNREFLTWTGKLKGQKVSVCSSGIGSPSTAIAVEELFAVGADTVIRVGTAGLIQDNITDDCVLIATGAVRDEGTSQQYIPLAYPALADIEVTWSLIESARHSGLQYKAGIVQSKDSFYGEVEPESSPAEWNLKYRWETWKRGNVLASEMEAATLFVVSSIRNKRAGCILGNHVNMKEVIKISVGAICELISMDYVKISKV